MFFNKTKPLIASFAVTVLEFTVFLVWGLNMNNGDEMGFSLITTYFLFPLTTLILSAYLTRKNPIFMIPFVPVMFAAQNFMPFIIYGTFEISLILCFTLIPAFIGMVIGMLIKHYKN